MASIGFIVFDIFIAVMHLTSVVSTVIRSVIVFLAIPFSASANVLVIFFKWNNLKNNLFIRRMMVFGFVFFALMFIGLGGFVAVVYSGGLRQKSLYKFNYTVPTGEKVTDAEPQPFCKFRVRNWSLIELAAISMCTAIDEKSVTIEKIFANFAEPGVHYTWMLLGRGTDFPWIFGNKSTAERRVIALESFSRAHQFAFLLENVVDYWSDRIMSLVVPFFELASELLIGPFIQDYARALDAFVALGDVSRSSWNDTSTLFNYVSDKPIYVGHGPGGLLSKALAMEFDSESVAFDAPSISGSQLIGNLNRKQTRSLRLIQVTSGNALFAMPEKGVAENIQGPGHHVNIIMGATPFETFCMLAAACVATDQYDELCSATVGPGAYEEYFMMWGRNRNTSLISL
jgi:hypothetical protein